MKILDFEKDKIDLPVQFDRETVMVMAFVNKVIVFDKPHELMVFGDVFDHVAFYLENNDEDKYNEYCEMLYWFSDQCEEEYVMINYEKNGQYRYEGRKLKLEKTDLNAEYDDYTVMRFGVLNSKDTYTNMEELQKIVEIMEIYMQTPELNEDLDMNELSMITNIIEIFKEDIAKSKSNPSDFFKISFKES